MIFAINATDIVRINRNNTVIANIAITKIAVNHCP
jgi:hypothetical protein